MSTKTDPRIVDLEARMAVLHSRVMKLERVVGVAEPQAPAAPARIERVAAPPSEPVAAPRVESVAPPSIEPVAAPRPEAPRPEAPRPEAPRPASAPRRAPAARPTHAPRHAPAQRARVELPDLEELLGGRVLAWVGGIAVVLGLAFFFALAISRGWIDEEARCLFGGAAALSLLAAGIWLREQRGRNEAAMAAAATGLAGLFLDIVVATQTYDLLPSSAGLAVAMMVGAIGTLLALRWNAPVIGAIGTIGSVLAPALAGADAGLTTIAFLWLATAAGAVVLVYKRWDWLGLALFVVSAPQWVPWTVGDASPAQAAITLAAFGAAGLAAAVGFELRNGSKHLGHASAFLMAANSIVIAIAGWTALGTSSDPSVAKLWLAGLAVVHAIAGASMRFEHRISPALRTLCIALAVVLGDVAWGVIASGPAIGVGWALGAIGFAWALTRRGTERVERQGAVVGIGGQIAIALLRVLAEDAPASHLSGAASADAIIALAALAASCIVSARLAEDGHEEVRRVLDAAGLAVVAYLMVFSLDGLALVAALAAMACGLAAIGRARDDQLARGAALAFLGLAAAHTAVIEAPPRAFLYGADHLLAMLGALAAVALATLYVVDAIELDASWLLRARAGAAATALYGASVAIVTAFQPDAGQAASTVLDIGARQQGQMLVSALWSVTGAVTLVLGLSRGSRELRVAGLAVFVASVAKVFVFDLATLTSIYRVMSLIALGLLLLAGSYAWQRSRPAPLPDLRRS